MTQIQIVSLNDMKKNKLIIQIGKHFINQPYQSVRDVFAHGGEVTNNECHQVSAHVDTGLCKLILQEVTGKVRGLCLRHTLEGVWVFGSSDKLYLSVN